MKAQSSLPTSAAYCTALFDCAISSGSRRKRHKPYSLSVFAITLLVLLLVVCGQIQAQREPSPPRRAGALLYVTATESWKQAITAVVDSNATIHERSRPQIAWPSRLRPERACRADAASSGATKPLLAGVSVLSQHPIDVSVQPDGSGASEVGALVATTSDTGVIVAHYLRVWRREGRRWLVAFVCTSPIRNNVP